MNRTLGWWLTRIELSIAVGAILLFALLFPVLIDLCGWGGSCFGGDPPLVAGLSSRGVAVGLGGMGLLFGLAWMVRIDRDLRREPPSSWRYRNQA